MARTKKVKKVAKPKAKAKKGLQIGPRLRLEPRLTPKPSKRSVDKPVVEDSTGFLKIHEQGESCSLVASSSYDPSKEIKKDYESEPETSHLVYNSVVNESSSLVASSSTETSKEQEHEISTVEYQALVDGVIDDEEEENIAIKGPRKKYRKSYDWNDRELMDLVIGLQNEGFSDLKKVAAYVKTKSENDIRVYLKKRSGEELKTENSDGKRNTWNTVSLETITKWPNVRKWRKLAYEQMLTAIRCKDYSKPVILALCKRFYEEEAETVDPQVINVKMIYKYIMDCMSGEVPPQLPPKESTLVLDLLREVQLMPLAYDFEEELKFLKGFKEATKFRPFQVKDEFKKRFKSSHNNEALGPNTVSVPEEVFMDLSRHKKLLQSFNPLVAPVWMLQKEQEVLEKHVEESSVYID